jgi:phosphatidylserine decarboxylase
MGARDTLNYLVTNRIPRRALTRFMARFSRIEQSFVRDVSLAVWRACSDLDLSDAKETRFRSVHDCFTRELAPGARAIDPDPAVVTSPCDAIVGACGPIEDATLLQAKHERYPLAELLQSDALAATVHSGCYATLRLTPAMYHRFHAPYDCRVRRITYVAGDLWNVNPPTLARVPQVFCRNERAIVETTLDGAGQRLLLVPVAAILVASIRFRFVDVRLHLRYAGPNPVECDAALRKGEEMGWFEHGSTIIVLAPAGFSLARGVAPGTRIRVGAPLLRLPEPDATVRS